MLFLCKHIVEVNIYVEKWKDCIVINRDVNEKEEKVCRIKSFGAFDASLFK